jgi:hypothetical protein
VTCLHERAFQRRVGCPILIDVLSSDVKPVMEPAELDKAGESIGKAIQKWG